MERDTSEHDRPVRDPDMIGSEAQEPGPGRDTALTDPDPAVAGSDQPRGTVAMSDDDPARTRLGAHVEGAGLIGHDVAAAERAAVVEDRGAADEPDQDTYTNPATYTSEEAKLPRDDDR